MGDGIREGATQGAKRAARAGAGVSLIRPVFFRLDARGCDSGRSRSCWTRRRSCRVFRSTGRPRSRAEAGEPRGLRAAASSVADTQPRRVATDSRKSVRRSRGADAIHHGATESDLRGQVSDRGGCELGRAHSRRMRVHASRTLLAVDGRTSRARGGSALAVRARPVSDAGLTRAPEP